MLMGVLDIKYERMYNGVKGEMIYCGKVVDQLCLCVLPQFDVLKFVVLFYMAWTSHDQLFGWVHTFRFNRNNYAFGGKLGTNDRPYPVIINEPNFIQVWNNWNKADTSLFLTFFLAGLVLARRWAIRDVLSDAIVERRADFKRFHRILTFFGFTFAMRNSCNRLEGYVPNGLPKENHQLVKYDFTSQILNSTFWKYIFETHDKKA